MGSARTVTPIAAFASGLTVATGTAAATCAAITLPKATVADRHGSADREHAEARPARLASSAAHLCATAACATSASACSCRVLGDDVALVAAARTAAATPTAAVGAQRAVDSRATVPEARCEAPTAARSSPSGAVRRRAACSARTDSTA